MSSNRITRRVGLLGLLACLPVLAACGFTPVYAPGGAGTVLQNAVTFSAPETVAGYRLRERLSDRLGTATNPRFTLDTQISNSAVPATITVDGDTTRFNLAGIANWTLTDSVTGDVTSGRVETFTSYSATGSTVATQAAESDAIARLSMALADLIVARLYVQTQSIVQ